MLPAHRAQTDAPDERAYRASVLSIGWQVAAVCAGLVVAGGALALVYVWWQTTPAQLNESHGSHDVLIYMNPVDLVVAGLIVGAGAVLCAGLAAWLIARRAIRPLDEAFRMQRRFIADASHELRTPIAVVSARAQQLAAMTPEDDERRDVVDALREDARIMSGVVDELLELASDSGATARDSAEGDDA
ncbi:sensor histidine kinase [Demequina capsici]|uniref:histidine kinase n=1 Tax=Demequina capsici TaxID=3075620 RepID=A0AA96F7V1_9MICO|nr:histidine kinase dimerization/phospho-acceptor domain-containing protein [Demequina sp. OYTSA14]WNM24422.1 histidine kinase dimerization/phospho-acceptor domain-containing protein [Demequina sp. OYTSA14]